MTTYEVTIKHLSSGELDETKTYTVDATDADAAQTKAIRQHTGHQRTFLQRDGSLKHGRYGQLFRTIEPGVATSCSGRVRIDITPEV